MKTDYNALYLYFLALFSYIPIKDLYLIKILSFVFDYIMAFGMYKLTKECINKKSQILPLIAYSCTLLMPTVIMNSGEWVQCDSIYVAFLIWSLYFMITKKYNTCFILYGIAITFKLQAIFLFPVYGIIFLKNKEFSIIKFLLIPLVNFILYIPAILLGKPILSIYDAYLSQIGHYSYKTVLGYPNIYYFFNVDKVSLIKPGIYFTMFILLLILVFVMLTKGKLSNNEIIQLSIFVLFIVPYLLPQMHDRYAYGAEVLSIVYFIMVRKHYTIWLLINVIAVTIYDSFLHGVPEDIMIRSACLQFIVVCYFAYEFINKRINNVKINAKVIYNNNMEII